MPALMKMGVTPMRWSYSFLTSDGDDATFSKNVSTGMFGYAALSSVLILTSSLGCCERGSLRPFLPLLRKVLPWHGLPPPTTMAWIVRRFMMPSIILALTSSTAGTWTMWSMEASAILTTSGLLSAAKT